MKFPKPEPKKKSNPKRLGPSDKRAEDQRLYGMMRSVWLLGVARGQGQALPRCERCKGLATEVHHRAGRTGHRLRDFSNCVALCSACHAWVETHPLRAKEQGFSESKLLVERFQEVDDVTSEADAADT